MNKMAARGMLFLFLITASWRLGSSQNLGPGNCLINRLDVIPCRFRNPTTTSSPGPKEYGIYNTVFRPGPAGLPTCFIRRKRHVIRPIQQIGNTGEVMIFYSPGFTLDPPENYGNQAYVDYNIVCKEGEVAYLSLTNLDMEGETCEDPNFVRMRCVDYLLVQFGVFGSLELCGNNTSINVADSFVPGTLRIIFRTSESNRKPGFSASAICFDPGSRDQPGCTRPNEDESPTEDSLPTMTPGEGRKKRDLEKFHDQWKRRLAYINRMKRQVGGGGRVALRFKEINVPHGMNVTYSNKKLDFIDVLEEKIIAEMSLENIFTLYTFDANGQVDAFIEDAKGDNTEELLLLPGPGPMFVVGRNAFFQLFVIDPRGLVPNAVEMEVLANFTEAQLNVAREQESDRLTPDILEPPTADPLSIGLPPLRRKKRQNEMRPSFDDEVILMALENENACNPILRASANAIIEEVEMTDPDRLKRLRAIFAAASPTDQGMPTGN